MCMDTIKKKPAEPSLKGKIRKAAPRLFYERGVEAVAVRDIVKAAGTTQPMLYYYFGCKDDLCQDLLRRLLRDLIGGAGEIMAADKPLNPKLAELFAFYRDFFAGRPGAARFILQGFLSPSHGKSFREITSKAEVVHLANIGGMLQKHENKGELEHPAARRPWARSSMGYSCTICLIQEKKRRSIKLTALKDWPHLSPKGRAWPAPCWASCC